MSSTAGDLEALSSTLIATSCSDHDSVGLGGKEDKKEAQAVDSSKHDYKDHRKEKQIQKFLPLAIRPLT